MTEETTSNKQFQTPAFVQKVETMVDGGNKVILITRELAPDEMTLLFGMRNKEGYFLFKKTQIKLEDIDVPDTVPEFKGEKTPSQRLRNTIYILWQQNRKDGQTSEAFYRDYMEKITDMVKEKLD